MVAFGDNATPAVLILGFLATMLVVLIVVATHHPTATTVRRSESASAAESASTASTNRTIPVEWSPGQPSCSVSCSWGRLSLMTPASEHTGEQAPGRSKMRCSSRHLPTGRGRLTPTPPGVWAPNRSISASRSRPRAIGCMSPDIRSAGTSHATSKSIPSGSRP